MTTSATHRQYLRTLSYDAEEETKLNAFFQAVTKTTLPPHTFLLHTVPPSRIFIFCSRLWNDTSGH